MFHFLKEDRGPSRPLSRGSRTHARPPFDHPVFQGNDPVHDGAAAPSVGPHQESATIVAVCVGSKCVRRWNGRSLKDDLQRAAVSFGVENLKVQSCGCLDRCKEGPIVSVQTRSEASPSRPREQLYVGVGPGDVDNIIRRAIIDQKKR